MSATLQWMMETHSAGETRALGAALAGALPGGVVLALTGELGAGKTCFVQGMADGLQSRSRVTSPTFTLLHEHQGTRSLAHADLYRLEDVEDLWEMGLAEAMDGDGLVAVEWADKARDRLPEDALWIDFTLGAGPDDRRLRMTWDHPAAARLKEVLAAHGVARH